MKTILNFDDCDELRLTEIAINPETLQSLPSYRMHSEGSQCCYNDSYPTLYIILQDMGFGTYWAFLRDYEIGYIKELGTGVYLYDEEKLKTSLSFVKIAGIDLARRVDAGEIDLDQEIYDYYHVLPPKMKVNMVYSGSVISVADAANQLGCSASRVKKMAEDRMIEAYRIGGDVLITQESVDSRIAYIEKHGKPTKNTTFRTMNLYAVMTPETTDACYDAAIEIWQKGADINDKAYEISRNSGMSKNSAWMYIRAVIAMLGGEPFTKDINTYSVNRYLDRIYEDFGTERMPIAWRAIEARNADLKKQGYFYAYYQKAIERSKQVHVDDIPHVDEGNQRRAMMAEKRNVDKNESTQLTQPSGPEFAQERSVKASPSSLENNLKAKIAGNLSELENRDFAFACIDLLAKRGLTPEIDANTLLNPSFCKTRFGSTFAILQDVTGHNARDIDLMTKDGKGRRRYYDRVFRVGQKDYIVMNDWYGKSKSPRDNRSPFLNWLLSRIAG